MSLLRGIQSAIFYYVSCAPCTKYTARKKRKKQIARDTKDRNTLELDGPDVYRQPLPYRTNEFWASEISSGPGPPPRNVTRKERENRRQAKRLEDMERSVGAGTKKMAIKAPESVTSEHILSVDGMKTMLRQALPTTERWHRNQREDEALWGSPSLESLPDSRKGPVRQGSGGGSSVGFPGLSHSQGSTESFYTGRNPPINDLHPPVVSNPSVNKAGNKWMLQPPPTSGVMNGFVTADDNRSRSGSGGSATSWRRGGDVRLARQISQKIIQEKLSRGELIPSPSSPPRSIQHVPRGISPKKQSSEEAGSTTSTVIRNPLSKAALAPSSSSTVVPGTSDSGVDVTLPPQIWSKAPKDVPGTSQQDFAFAHNNPGAKAARPIQATAWAVSQDGEQPQMLAAPFSRSSRSATVNLAEPARAYFIDGPRAVVSASTSPVKIRQHRNEPSAPQAFSTSPKYPRRKDYMSASSLVPPQAHGGSEEYFSSQSRDRVRTKTRKLTERISPDESLDIDEGADADTEDEGADDSLGDVEIGMVSRMPKTGVEPHRRKGSIQDSSKHQHTRQMRRRQNRDIGTVANNATPEQESGPGETDENSPVKTQRVQQHHRQRSQPRQKQHQRPAASQADFDAYHDGISTGDVGGTEGKKGEEDDFGWVRSGRGGHVEGEADGHTLLLRRWSVDF